jgi:hypothetical protein
MEFYFFLNFTLEILKEFLSSKIVNFVHLTITSYFFILIILNNYQLKSFIGSNK